MASALPSDSDANAVAMRPDLYHLEFPHSLASECQRAASEAAPTSHALGHARQPARPIVAQSYASMIRAGKVAEKGRQHGRSNGPRFLLIVDAR